MQKYVEYNLLLLINPLALLFLTRVNKHDSGGTLNHLFDAVKKISFSHFCCLWHYAFYHGRCKALNRTSKINTSFVIVKLSFILINLENLKNLFLINDFHWIDILRDMILSHIHFLYRSIVINLCFNKIHTCLVLKPVKKK